VAQAGGRLRRINEALREVIAESVQRELADPRLSFLTITHVRATQDLKEAKVFWTTLDRTKKDGAAAALESARGVLQGRVGRELRARQTPQLTFVFDEHQDRAAELTRLIDEVTGNLPPREEEVE
jgi:ribosome-binding factor A